MKAKEIREMSDEALQTKVQDLREEIFNLKFQHAIRPMENTAKLRELKKDVARLNTVITERRTSSNSEN